MNPSTETAPITGTTGQDGSYLADFCWKKATPCTVGIPIERDR